MKRGDYLLRIFWKKIYELDNIIDGEIFENLTQMKIQKLRPNSHKIKI